MNIPTPIDDAARASHDNWREDGWYGGASTDFMKNQTKEPISRQVPAKWRHHYQKLQSLRHSLLASNEGMEPSSCQPVLGTSSGFDPHLVIGILLHEQDALFEVDAAMQRILDGTYGVCEETGNPIPESRLRVVPWTRFTKEALERLERERMAGRADLGPFALFQGASPV